MENEKPILEFCIFNFTQEGNCVDSEDFESLEIKYVSSLGLDRDKEGFYILKTDSWAIDSTEDLKMLFERIEKVMNK